MDTTKPRISSLTLPLRRRTGLAEQVFLRLMNRLQQGGLEMTLPDGSVRRFGEADHPLQARLHVHRPAFFRKVLRSGGIGLGESYMEGDWSSADLTVLLTVFARNQNRFAFLKRGLHLLARFRDRLAHLRRHNHPANSKRNIAEHYDLSNAFYQTFLDPSLSYSSALYDPAHQTLEAAQENKIRRVLDLSGIQPGQTLLEIGSGWGALAICAARHYGCRVVSITLSEEQLALARQRAEEAGLADRIEFRLLDYRHLDLQADALVSVEMIEAVGHEYLPAYFDTIARCLKPGARAVLQAITIPDERYPAYCRSTDFMKKHIFPGGHLPSPGALRRNIERTGRLVLEDMQSFGRDYGRTLDEWHRRFSAAAREVERLGFDARFRRKWAFYLSFCEAGFNEGLIDVRHVILRAA